MPGCTAVSPFYVKTTDLYWSQFEGCSVSHGRNGRKQHLMRWNSLCSLGLKLGVIFTTNLKMDVRELLGLGHKGGAEDYDFQPIHVKKVVWIV